MSECKTSREKQAHRDRILRPSADDLRRKRQAKLDGLPLPERWNASTRVP